MIAMAVGTVLALLALGYVLYPLLVGAKPRGVRADRPACPRCGIRPESDASFCSSCGSALSTQAI